MTRIFAVFGAQWMKDTVYNFPAQALDWSLIFLPAK
jgi:hypothetical protein